MKTVLVTGGSGFIGSHLVKYLLLRGYKVRCLVRRSSLPAKNAERDVEYYYGDLLDRESLEPAVSGVACVFHLAAAMTGHFTRDDFFRVNASGTQNLLEACIRTAPDLIKFVHVSSISSVGPRNDVTVLSEDDPCLPVDFYGESKLAGEEVAIGYSRTVPVIIIRPPLVYGPGDKNPLTVLRYMNMVGRGIYIIRGSKKKYMSIIYVKDLAEGLTIAAENRQAGGRIYFLCNDEPTTYDEICRLTAAALRKKAVGITIPSFALSAARSLQNLAGNVMGGKKGKRNAPPSHWVCSGTRARRELAFEVKTPLAEGIKDTALWYRAQGWI